MALSFHSYLPVFGMFDLGFIEILLLFGLFGFLPLYYVVKRDKKKLANKKPEES